MSDSNIHHMEQLEIVPATVIGCLIESHQASQVTQEVDVNVDVDNVLLFPAIREDMPADVDTHLPYLQSTQNARGLIVATTEATKNERHRQTQLRRDLSRIDSGRKTPDQRAEAKSEKVWKIVGASAIATAKRAPRFNR